MSSSFVNNIISQLKDLRALFSFFDADKNGDIDFEEFLNGVKVIYCLPYESII